MEAIMRTTGFAMVAMLAAAILALTTSSLLAVDKGPAATQQAPDATIEQLESPAEGPTFHKIPGGQLPEFQQAPTIQQQPKTGTKAGGGVGGFPGGSVKELTADECRKLGCTVITDNTCDAIKGEGGVDIKQRCVCSGGNSLCVNQR
jgi:hypothetical protein